MQIAMPSDGYTPDGVTYHIHNPGPVARDVLTIAVVINGEGNMSPEQAEALVRPHMDALYADVLAATGEPVLRLLRTYHGSREEDLTPPAGEV